MTTRERADNVVHLKENKSPSEEGWTQREQEALAIARLAALSDLDYERSRITAAKQLGCRVSWLDRKIEHIRYMARRLTQGPAHDGRTVPGTPIIFCPDNAETLMGFLVKSDHCHDRDRHLIVLADGAATPVISSPIESS
jgi:hypothetical protein